MEKINKNKVKIGVNWAGWISFVFSFKLGFLGGKNVRRGF